MTTPTILEAHTPATTRARLTEDWLDGDYGATRYWLSTTQQGLPLLFIHGYGALIDHWRRLLPLLSDAHTLCALDLYNFGYSARLQTPPTRELWAAQAAQVIADVLQEPAVVVGHSMGGMVATQLAHAYPHLVRGLVVSNSVGLPPERKPGAFERTLFHLLSTPMIGDMLASVMTNSWMVRQSLQPAYYDPKQVTPELVEIFSGPLRLPDGPQGYLAATRSFRNFALPFAPGAISVPALIFWGSDDRSMPVSMAEKFRQRFLPHADVHILEQTAHCPFDERPEEFARVLLAWLAKLENQSQQNGQVPAALHPHC